MTQLGAGELAGPASSVRSRSSSLRSLADQADEIVATCVALARAFRHGATLFVVGSGPAAADAQHVAVEFGHPVVVGKPALPALSLANDAAILSAHSVTGSVDEMFAAQLRVLASRRDALLVIAPGEPDRAALHALDVARDLGLLTLAVVGGRSNVTADHVVRTGGDDRRLAKEADVTAYHLLWELTHVALEHGDVVAPQACATDTCITCSDEAVPATVLRLLDDDLAAVDAGAGEEEVSVALVDASVGSTVLVHAREAIAVVSPAPGDDGQQAGGATAGGIDALYPFLATEPAGPVDVSADLRASTVAKIVEAEALRAECVRLFAASLTACAEAIAERVLMDGRLLVFGNGGSSTDAQTLAGLFLQPGDSARAVPALSLTADVATLTALANDVGFDVVFARQLASLGRPNDVAIALSTSGNSDNVIRGLTTAARLGMLTVGFAGNGGGQMAAEADLIDHLFVVPSASVHRIQEAQATLYDLLWEAVQSALPEEARRN
jgi:D-sedoheptulose 7-phosphate isomerase